MPPPLTSVLIVDDEPAVRDLIARWVSALGLRAQTAASAEEALAALRCMSCDMAVIDVMMPGCDGLRLAEEVQRTHPRTAVVIATAYADLLVTDADARPLVDLLVKPFPRERFALAVDRGRQWRQDALDDVHSQTLLSIEVRDRAAEVSTLLAERTAHGIAEADVLDALAAERIPDVAAHGARVARYARAVARQLGLPAGRLQQLQAAARFHDIGKIAMPAAVMTKPAPLTPVESQIMQLHVEVGADLLELTQTLADAAPAVRAAHEWFDGRGYPRGLAGEAIPLNSRIIAVADAYDAMTQQRAYRRPVDSVDAVAELQRCSVGQFDPRVVAAFLAVVERH